MGERTEITADRITVSLTTFDFIISYFSYSRRRSEPSMHPARSLAEDRYDPVVEPANLPQPPQLARNRGLGRCEVPASYGIHLANSYKQGSDIRRKDREGPRDFRN